MIKKIEMATRLLYNGPSSSEFESMALYNILHHVNIKYKTNKYEHVICWQASLNHFIDKKKKCAIGKTKS